MIEGDRASLEAELKRVSAELARAEVRLEELEAQHRFDDQRLNVLDAERAGLRDAVEAHDPDRASLERMRAKNDALVRHLARTQAALDARTDQLSRLLGSRWYRVARSAWRARRRRPPLGALVLLGLAAGGVGLGSALASTVATALAAILGALLIAGLAVGYSVVVPALRDKAVPRMAGQGTFADALPDEAATLEDLLSESDPRPEERSASPAPSSSAAPATAVAGAMRLVPALPAMSASARQQWLAASRTQSLAQLRVAGVLDDMSRACFAPECALRCDFTMYDWRERLEADPPHLLLVESAWNGNSGGWQYGVASYPHPDFRGLPALRALLEWCAELGIPTVFWNKEDPIHFERFKEAAALFDHVFTTDVNMVAAYEQLRGPRVRSVEALPFAAQPRLHNPIAVVDERRREPVFAGTYYRQRHADRRASLEMLLDAARPFGLQIYDRTFGTQSDEYGFPDRFLAHVKGRLSYDEVIGLYKRHRVFLNVNSVTDSHTMFSRRVFELLACGTAVISTESVGIAAMFGELVPIVRTSAEATAALERLLGDDEHFTELTAKAQRLVLAEHTYGRRLAQIARTAGFDLGAANEDTVAALALVDGAASGAALHRVLLEQSRAPEEIVLGVGDPAAGADAAATLGEQFGAARVRAVAQRPSDEPAGRWRELATLATTTWVAPLFDGYRYDEHHLRDLVACTRFAAADVIGVAATNSAIHRYTQELDAAAVIAKRSLVAAEGWSAATADQRRAFERGARFYAAQAPGAPVDASVPAGASHDATRSGQRRARGVRRR